MRTFWKMIQKNPSFSPLPALWLETRHSISLNFSFLLHKMRIIIPVLKSCWRVMWFIFSFFFPSGLFCAYQEGYKLFKDIAYDTIPVKGGFSPFLFIHGYIHSPSRLIFCAARQQLHTERSPKYSILFTLGSSFIHFVLYKYLLFSVIYAAVISLRPHIAYALSKQGHHSDFICWHALVSSEKLGGNVPGCSQSTGQAAPSSPSFYSLPWSPKVLQSNSQGSEYCPEK